MRLCSHDIRGGIAGSGKVQMMDCTSFFFVPMTLGEEVWVVGKVRMKGCDSCFFVPMTPEEEVWVVGRFRWWTVIVAALSP